MINYFDIFELPRKFNIHENELRRKYLQMSRETHPDYYVGASPELVAEMEEKAAMLNTAYRTLKDELLRIRHLLVLDEIDLEKQALPNAFLMEVMELNELIEEDGMNPEIEQQIQKGKEILRQQLLVLMQSYDTATDSNDKHIALLHASEKVLCLRYYERLEAH
jgi:molecular chaperone HscB